MVLFLIVPNFQYVTCNVLPGEFAILLVLSFAEYERLLEAESG
jgi:hypothetical protein